MADLRVIHTATTVDLDPEDRGPAPPPLTPFVLDAGERVIDGRIYYSAAWIDTDPGRVIALEAVAESLDAGGAPNGAAIARALVHVPGPVPLPRDDIQAYDRSRKAGRKWRR